MFGCLNASCLYSNPNPSPRNPSDSKLLNPESLLNAKKSMF